LQRILDESGGSIAKAAAAFGVHRSTIYRWLRG
jgi:transposase